MDSSIQTISHMLAGQCVSNQGLSRERALQLSLVSASLYVVEALSKGLARSEGAKSSPSFEFNDTLRDIVSPAMSAGRSAVHICRAAACDEDLLTDPDSTVLLDILTPAINTLARLDPWEKEWALRYEALRDTVVYYMMENNISSSDLDIEPGLLLGFKTG